MGKIDWYDVEYDYLSQADLSYGDIAFKYGVAKSTVVRRAKKGDWVNKRLALKEKRVEELLLRTNQEKVEVEERELRILRAIQALAAKQLQTIYAKQKKGAELTDRDIRVISKISSLHHNNMMLERTILGLPTKPIRITNEEAIENFQIMMGYIDEPLARKLESRKEMIAQLERTLGRLKRQEDLGI